MERLYFIFDSILENLQLIDINQTMLRLVLVVLMYILLIIGCFILVISKNKTITIACTLIIFCLLFNNSLFNSFYDRISDNITDQFIINEKEKDLEQYIYYEDETLNQVLKECEYMLLKYNKDAIIYTDLKIYYMDKEDLVIFAENDKAVGVYVYLNDIIFISSDITDKEELYSIVMHELVHYTARDDFLSDSDGEAMTDLTARYILKYHNYKISENVGYPYEREILQEKLDQLNVSLQEATYEYCNSDTNGKYFKKIGLVN